MLVIGTALDIMSKVAPRGAFVDHPVGRTLVRPMIGAHEAILVSAG
jgi:hypothetical protein